MAQRSSPSSDFVWEVPTDPEPTTGGRLGRVPIGALYGFLVGVVYALVAGTIDMLVLRDVPIRVDWPVLWWSVITTGVGAAALAALTAWPAEAWRGVVAGAAGLMAWTMLQSFLKVQGAALVFLPLFLPLAVMSLPIAGVLRWAVSQHERNQERHGPARWRRQLLLWAAILWLGAFAGSWSQMGPEAREAVRKVNRMVDRALSEPATAPLPFALKDVPDLRRHAGSPYGLEQQPSGIGTSNLDVRVRFDDGYVVTCTVDPEAGSIICVEGEQSLFGPAVYDPNEQQ